MIQFLLALYRLSSSVSVPKRLIDVTILAKSTGCGLHTGWRHHRINQCRHDKTWILHGIMRQTRNSPQTGGPIDQDHGPALQPLSGELERRPGSKSPIPHFPDTSRALVGNRPATLPAVARPIHSNHTPKSPRSEPCR